MGFRRYNGVATIPLQLATGDIEGHSMFPDRSTRDAPMTLVNLTPHDVTVRLPDGTDYVIPKTGEQARVTVETIDRPPINTYDSKQLPFVGTTYGNVEGLPAPQAGTCYIVSSLVLGQVKGRNDCFAPDTSPASAIRNEAGQIQAVKRLVAAS